MKTMKHRLMRKVSEYSSSAANLITVLISSPLNRLSTCRPSCLFLLPSQFASSEGQSLGEPPIFKLLKLYRTYPTSINSCLLHGTIEKLFRWHNNLHNHYTQNQTSNKNISVWYVCWALHRLILAWLPAVICSIKHVSMNGVQKVWHVQPAADVCGVLIVLLIMKIDK